LRTLGGDVGAGAEQQAAQANADRTPDAQRLRGSYRCNPDSKGTKLTGPRAWRSIRVSPFV